MAEQEPILDWHQAAGVTLEVSPYILSQDRQIQDGSGTPHLALSHLQAP